MLDSGPYVNVDKLCEIFDKIRLPDSAVSSGTEPNSIKLFDLAKSVQWIVGAEDTRKRKSIGRKGDDSDDDSNISAPSNDLYRKRQQKKIKWWLWSEPCFVILVVNPNVPGSYTTHTTRNSNPPVYILYNFLSNCLARAHAILKPFSYLLLKVYKRSILFYSVQ